MEYYSAVKKKEEEEEEEKEKKKKILPFSNVWVHLENIVLSEISQSEKDKYQMISLICGI